jgi:hypothetical protein
VTHTCSREDGNHADGCRPIDTVTLPREQVERVLRVLEGADASLGDDSFRCPALDCSWTMDSLRHAPDCELAASIADLKALGL